ncbi:MAG: penicillin acylase family protein [Candidatus Baldrarchaeia archaeon]
MKRGVIGLILAVALTIAFLIPLPGMFAPSSLMSMTNPLAGIWGSVYTAKYPSRGKIVMPGLENDITVIIDGYGVPHIFAKSEIDVAYVLGYLHAHDRLFQMDLQRRLVEGRLSEVTGEAAYQTDVLYRILGLYRGAQKSLELLENISKGEEASYYPQIDVTLIKDDAKKLLDMLDAYSKGVNFAIEEMEKKNALPLEFKLLGYKPEPWTPLNSLEIGRLISWGLTGTFADLELYLIYQGLVGKYGVENGTKLLLELLPIDRPIDHFLSQKMKAVFTPLIQQTPSKHLAFLQ